MSSENHSRVILHLDIDAFYAQVEENCQPELKTKPVGVYQKTIIVTSNYVAREYGIKKCMLTTEAIKLCPNLVLVNGENLEKYRQFSQDITRFIQEKYKVPVEKLGFDENFVDITKLVQDKLDLIENKTGSHTLWDRALARNILPSDAPQFSDDDDDFGSHPFDHAIPVNEHGTNKSRKRKCESANLEHNLENLKKKAKLNPWEIDEQLFTQPEGATNIEHENRNSSNVTKVVGHVYNDIPGKCTCGCINRITIGTHIASDIRQDIFNEYNLTLSGGISCNKLLSKLVGSLHKPNQQTVIFPNAALDLMSHIELRQIPGIGSKMVEKLANLNIKTIEQLQNTNKAKLCKTFDATLADWLLNVSYGKDSSQVKNFGKQSSIGVEDRYAKPITNQEEYIKECKVLLGRLLILVKKDGRIPRLLKLHLRFDHFKFEWKLDSKQCQISTSAFSNAVDKTENYLTDVLVKLYKELCVKRNSHTITYINIALGNFIDITSSENSILKFCQNKSNTISNHSNKNAESSNKNEYGTFKATPCSTRNSTNSCQQDYTTDGNSSETISHPATANSELRVVEQRKEENVDFQIKNNIDSNYQSTTVGTNSYITYQSTSSSHTDTNKPTVSPIEANNSYTNNLDVNTIDRSVLNELPDDIREEIERELYRQNRGTGSQMGTQNQVHNNTESYKKSVDNKNKPKKTIRQLSMLNFVRKK
uniref:DNA polymerase iota n=1 Tax=Cacopsylla melanoneura TaxID=428564 RepID=A0A8D8UXM6_9HEMI